MSTVGVIKCADGVFQLGPTITTVGLSKDSDLVLYTLGAAENHAVFQFSKKYECFYLEDLATGDGTYINSCRLNKAATRLCNNDIIRFGSNGMDFQFNVTVPDLMVRRERNCSELPEPIVYIAGVSRLQSVVDYKNGIVENIHEGVSKPPAPPGGCSRPITETECNNEVQRQGLGWIIGGKARDMRLCQLSEVLADETLSFNAMQCIQCLVEEVKRLRVFETKHLQREKQELQLREEITYLQRKFREFDVGCHIRHIGDVDVRIQLEPKSDGDTKEGGGFCSSMANQPRTDRASSSPAATVAAAEVGEGDERCCPDPTCAEVARSPNSDEISQLRAEQATHLEVAVMEKESVLGLLSKLKGDMANKDRTVSYMASELAKAKEDLLEKQCLIEALTEQICCLHIDSNCDDEKIENEKQQIERDRELYILRHKMMNFPEFKRQQQKTIEELQAECRRLSAVVKEKDSELKKLNSTIQNTFKLQASCESRAVVLRTDAEVALAKYAKLKSLVMHAGLTPPPSSGSPDQGRMVGSMGRGGLSLSRASAQIPKERLMTDEEICNALRQALVDRTVMTTKIKALEENAAKQKNTISEGKES